MMGLVGTAYRPGFLPLPRGNREPGRTPVLARGVMVYVVVHEYEVDSVETVLPARSSRA